MSMTQTEDRVGLLQDIFRRIQNPADWRAPIKAVCEESERDLVAEAITFFTATEARFSPAENGTLWVNADGYRNGPCGP